MRLRKVAVVSALALTFVLGLVIFSGSESTTKAALVTCSVPTGSYPTIQSAVNDAGCTTIDVAAGAYVENVTINRSLTLNGAQAGNPVAGRIFGAGGESTLNGLITVQAAGVTIDGFSLTNPSQNFAILVKVAGDNALITNNIINTVGSTSLASNPAAIYLERGPDNVSVIGNQISNVHSIPTAQGVLVGDSVSGNPSVNILIEGNTIENITSGTRGAYGIQVNNGASTAPTATGFTIVVIRDNTIRNLTGGTGMTCPGTPTPPVCGWVHAIGLEGDTPGVIVESNDISNLFAATPDSIAVFFQANPSFDGADVHFNNFNLTAASYGIAVHPALSTAFPNALVDGECNWWGSPSGPTSGSNPGGTGAQVGPNVDYTPWQIAPEGACIGGNVPTTASQCKNGGWMTQVRSDGSTFKNQGDCIQYVNTGK